MSHPIEALKALEAQATPAPWERSTSKCVEYFGDFEEAGPGSFFTEEDADLTAILRNLAKPLIDLWEVNLGMEREYTRKGGPRPETVADFHRARREALKALNAKAAEVLK